MAVEAHYLFVHPQRQAVAAAGVCLRSSGPAPWNGTVWVDPVDGTNEDPFVWRSKWLYSYCKATSLRRAPGPPPRMTSGSTIIFVDKDRAKAGALLVDTIFRVATVHQWMAGLPPSSLYVRRTDPAYVRHLQFGFGRAKAHPGKFTYEAQPALAFGTSGSFLPIDSNRERVTVPLAALSTALHDKIASGLRWRLPPILLEPKECDDILSEVWKRTSEAVVELTSMRLPRWKNASGNCGKSMTRPCGVPNRRPARASCA